MYASMYACIKIENMCEHMHCIHIYIYIYKYIYIYICASDLYFGIGQFHHYFSNLKNSCPRDQGPGHGTQDRATGHTAGPGDKPWGIGLGHWS